MTVYFIGAGPGAADLITVRGQRLLQRCQVCLYAGSIMPADLLALPGARVNRHRAAESRKQIIDGSPGARRRPDVARLRSGDPRSQCAVAESRAGGWTRAGRSIVPGYW